MMGVKVNPDRVPKPVLDQLKDIFVGLPEATQAQLGPLASAVYMFLEQDNPTVAKLVIEGAQIPAELEAVRAQMLGKFDDL